MGELLDIQQKNEKFIIGKKIKRKITIEEISFFLCDSLNKNLYTTRGWNQEDIFELNTFLYPEGNAKFDAIMKIPLKILKIFSIITIN